MNIFKKIKIIIKLNSIVNKFKKEVKMEEERNGVKSGIRTSEFWLLVISNLMTIAGTLQGVIPPDTGAIIVASLTGIYNVLRTIAKKS